MAEASWQWDSGALGGESFPGGSDRLGALGVMVGLICLRGGEEGAKFAVKLQKRAEATAVGLLGQGRVGLGPA